MSCILNSLKGLYRGLYVYRSLTGPIKSDTRSLDYSSYGDVNGYTGICEDE